MKSFIPVANMNENNCRENQSESFGFFNTKIILGNEIRVL